MSDLQRILFKVLVKEFYRINAGFFLIVIGICFGFLQGTEHMALARYFTSSAFLLLVPFAVWITYSLKIIAFNALALEKRENEFLFALGAIAPVELWLGIFRVALWQFIPALVYGAFLVAVALQSGPSSIPFIIVGLLLLPSLAIATLLYGKLKYPNPGVAISYLRRKANASFSRPYFLFYPEWITARQPVLVIGTKIFSCLMIIAIAQLYRFDTYDERLFTMGCALIFSFNLIIVFHYHRFENFHFPMMRSLPLSHLRRLLYFIVAYILLILPEIGAIINYFPEGLSKIQLIPVLILGLGTSIVFYGLLFLKDINLETFIQYVFWICLAWIVLILFKVPALVLTVIHLGIGIMVFKRNYYRFEFNAEVGSEK